MVLFLFLELKFVQLTMAQSRWWSCDPDLSHKEKKKPSQKHVCVYLAKYFFREKWEQRKWEEGRKDSKSTAHHYFALLSGE